MTDRCEGNKFDLFKVINTIMMSIICGLAMLIFANQSKTGEELVRLKTVQENNVQNVDKLSTRVLALERDNIIQLQKWVEDNYVRKPQDK